MPGKVAVVTGANKGLGLQVVKDLAQRLDGVIYLTARDEGRGKAALAAAAAELGAANGAKLRFHPLDLSSAASIAALRGHIQSEHGHLDVLVNNAGIAYNHDSDVPFAEQAKVTNATNYFANRDVCNALFPLLAPGARVVTVASRAGTMALKDCQPNIADRFRNATQQKQVDELVEDFVRLTAEGKHAEAGYPADTAYGISKLAVIALTELQAKALAADAANPDIVLNCCCPGYVNTDLTSGKGIRTVAEGADIITYLAVLPPAAADNPVGKFVVSSAKEPTRRVLDWRLGQTRKEAEESAGM